MEIRAQIINRLYEALEAIDAPLDLLQIVGRWSDTVSEDETLRQLEDFSRQASRHGLWSNRKASRWKSWNRA